MMQAFNGVENIEDLPGGDESSDEEEDGKTATFPFLNRLFSGSDAPKAADGGEENTGREEYHMEWHRGGQHLPPRRGEP